MFLNSVIGLILLGILLTCGVFISKEALAQRPPQTQPIQPETQGLTPSVCCQLKHQFRIGTESLYDEFVPGDIVGRPEGGYCPLGIPDYSTPHWAGLCTLDGIASFADWIKWLALIAVGVAIIFAGIMFITAAGNPERISKAKAIFLYSLIGVVVALAAQFIPGLARYFIGI